MRKITRRGFIKESVALSVAIGFAGCSGRLPAPSSEARLYRISLAEWSLSRSFQDGTMHHLDFPQIARGLGIEAVEYVNQFFMDRAEDKQYLAEMKSRAQDEGVTSVLIMCDREGAIGAPDLAERKSAIERHYKWVDAAAYLGCHAIRVNGNSEGDYEEQQKLVADGLSRLISYSDERDINVLIENHGGLSSNGKWLAGVMELVDHPRAGTLPDFRNFKISEDESYDSYLGVQEMMPYAKGISVKPRVYDAFGNQQPTDFDRMMRIVLDAGFCGYAGIEWGWEGDELALIRDVKRQLEQTHDDLAPLYAHSRKTTA